MAATKILTPPQRYYELINNNTPFVVKVGSNLYAVLADDVGTTSSLNCFIFKSVDSGANWTNVTNGKAAKGTGQTVSIAVKGTVIYVFTYLNPAGGPQPINVFRWDTGVDDWLSDGTNGPAIAQNSNKTLFTRARAATNEVVAITQTNTAVSFSVYNTGTDAWTTSLSGVYSPGPNLGVGAVGIDSADRMHVLLLRYSGAISVSNGVLVHIAVSSSGVIGTAQDLFTTTVATNNIAQFLISPLVAYTDTNHGGASIGFLFVDQHQEADLHRDVVLYTALEGAAPTWSSQTVPTGENFASLVPDNVGSAVDSAAIAVLVAASTGSGDAQLSVIWTDSGNPPLGAPYDAFTKWMTLDTGTATWGTIHTEFSSLAANIRVGPINPVNLSSTTFGAMFIAIDFDLFFGGGTNKYDSLSLWWFGATLSSLLITCANPPDGQVVIAYSHALPASGGTPPYTFAITAGILPPGLTLNASTGVISGSPVAYGTFPFTIQVTDSLAQTANVGCQIVILAPGTPSIICDNPPSGQLAVSYTHTFPASGGVPPYTFSISSGALPTGVVLNSITGVVSGTPTASGTFNFTVRVTDFLGQTADVACSIIIAGASRCPGGAHNDSRPWISHYRPNV